MSQTIVSSAAHDTSEIVYTLHVYLIKNQSNIQLTVVHSVDSFFALALAFVSLTFNSLALWTILSLYEIKLETNKHWINFAVKYDTLIYLPFAYGNILSNLSAVNSIVHQ